MGDEVPGSGPGLLILSRRSRLYSTRRLREECLQAGAVPQVVDPLRCVPALTDGTSSLLIQTRPLTNVDAVIPRAGNFALSYILGVLRHLEMGGVPCLNGSEGMRLAKDKLATLQRLTEAGVPIPDTLMARTLQGFRKLARRVGGAPLVMKLLRGSQGRGVSCADSLESAEAMLETVWSLDEEILLQEYIAESRGRDLRILVLGGEVVAAMRRFGRPGAFRSNLHRGGVGVGVPVEQIPPETAETAVRAVRAVGLGMAGVDILESSRGPLVIEVNSSPGFQGLEEATGMNVAGAIVAATLDLVGKGKPDSPSKPVE